MRNKPRHHRGAPPHGQPSQRARSDRNRPTFDHLLPVVPAAYSDGLIPVAALTPSLLIHAPIIDVQGYLTIAGDVFEACIDDQPVLDSRREYAPTDGAYVELAVSASEIQNLRDGEHALSYRVHPFGFGASLNSGKTVIRIDRMPAGGRCLPRIIFSEEIEIHGLSVDPSQCSSDAVLTGIVPDYAGIDARDTLHLFMRSRQTDIEIPAGIVSAQSGGEPIAARFDLARLRPIDGHHRVDFYYQIVDAVGLTSQASYPTPINVLFGPVNRNWRGNPADDVIEGYKPYVPAALHDGLVPNGALRRDLSVHAPLIRSKDHDTVTGNAIELLIDGEVVEASRVIYLGGEANYVELILPEHVGAALSEGQHDLAYRDTPLPFGDAVRSESVKISVDLTAAGHRGLPPIIFQDRNQHSVHSPHPSLAFGDGPITGTIADYANFHKDDKIHIYTRNGNEPQKFFATVPLSAGPNLTTVSFDPSAFESADPNGTIDVFYYVEDRANNISKASMVTTLRTPMVD
jgi:hypothetical protein